MYKHLLDRISGDIDWMALTSLVTFFLVFSMVIYVALAERKGHVDYMAGLPLRDDDNQKEPQS